MSKAPQGVYVHERNHNLTSRLVDNALDKHGNLSGFIDFVERNLRAAVEATPQWFAVAGDLEAPANEALAAVNASADFYTAHQTAGDGKTAGPERYRQAWSKLLAALPWLERGPQADAMALFLHSSNDAVWKHGGAISQERGFRNLHTFLEHVHERANAGTEPRDDTVIGTQIWRGNTLEIILEEPKSKSTSFYLDKEAHELAIRMLGRNFFDRAEEGLLNLLNTPNHWLRRQPELQFLEHGSNLIDYQNTTWDDENGRSLWEVAASPLHLPTELDGFDHPEVYAAVSSEVQRQFINMFTWERGWPLYGNTVLRLAHRLRLTDLRKAVDIRELKERLLPAFQERFGLNRIAPERELAYQILAHHSPAPKTEYANNAVDQHLLNLFQQYALTVLPEPQRTESRVHPAILATLAQPWVFPTRTTLEAYSNCNVHKDDAGQWHITKGKQTKLVLSDRDAYRTATLLNSLISPQPNPAADDQFFEPSPDINEVADEFYRGDTRLASNTGAWHHALQALHPNTRRINIPLNPDLIERALRLSKEPSSLASTGLLLMVELTDETLDSGGKFTEKYLERTIHDFTDYKLNNQQIQALQLLLEKAHAHKPAEFHRTTTSTGQGVWAYTHEGTRHTLEVNFDESMTTLAVKYAAGDPTNESNRKAFKSLTRTPDLESTKQTLERIYDHFANPDNPVVKAFDLDFVPMDADPERLIEAARIYQLAGQQFIHESVRDK